MKRAALFVLALLALLVGATNVNGAPRHVRVGLVLGPAGVATPYDRLAVAGLRKAVRELGVEAEVVTPSQREGYLESFLSLARRRYDVVIGGSALEAAAVDEAATRYPWVSFAVLDTPNELLPHRPRNVLGVTFAAQEAGYLAGYLAALTARARAGKHLISSVGGVKAPPVDAFIAGYEAGARQAAPGITTLRTYVHTFLDPAACRAAALAQIARGSTAVFEVAGLCGTGALAAAREKGVWGIGVDVDQSSLGPEILTSAVKNVDRAVYEIVRRAQQRRLFNGGRTIVLGLKDSGVGLGKISPKVPRALVAQVERVRREIVAGTIMVPAVVTR